MIEEFAKMLAEMNNVPFLSRLLLLLPLSSSSLSAPFSLVESTLSTLICRFNELVGPRLDGRYSGVFLAELKGLMNCFEGVLIGLASGTGWRFTLVNPALTAVKPLMAVNPDVTVCDAGCGAGVCASCIGVSLSEFTEACRALEACRAGESHLRLDGVLTFECFIGLGAGLGVSGPPFSVSNC